MPFTTLLETWSGSRKAELTDEHYSIRLRLEDAARIHALAELFPGNSPESLISDLLTTALDQVEASMPYVPGDKVIREDEFGDPIYEDVGITPRFRELVKTERKKLGGP